jgi:hypothetical protein
MLCSGGVLGARLLLAVFLFLCDPCRWFLICRAGTKNCALVRFFQFPVLLVLLFIDYRHTALFTHHSIAALRPVLLQGWS